MALDETTLRQIRQEIGVGYEPGVDDDVTLEAIFVSETEGNGSILVTALAVWRHRLGNLTQRAFDVTTEGSLLSRSQKIRFIERRIKELELLVDSTAQGHNAIVVGAGGLDSFGAGGGAEL